MELVFSMPVAEMDWDGEPEDVRCLSCDVLLPVDGEAYFDDANDGVYYCEPCSEVLAEEVRVAAEAYAAERCRITEWQDAPPAVESDYHPLYIESFIPHSQLCHYRHECTNYDELIKDLDRYSLSGRTCYTAIRERVTALIEERVRQQEAAEQESNASD